MRHREHIKKELNLLDGVALLLVTDSGIVATTITQISSNMKIEFAKNSATKISEDYIKH